MPDNKVLFSVRTPDGRTEQWDQQQYNELSGRLYEKYPEAQVVRVSSYVADDDKDARDSDAFQINLPDGRSERWSRKEFNELYEPLMKKYPDAQVSKMSDMSALHWESKAKDAQAGLQTLQDQNKDFLHNYEMNRNMADVLERDGVMESDFHNFVAANQDKYDALTKQREELRQQYFTNPVVLKGFREGAEAAAKLQNDYTAKADAAESGSERRDWNRAAKLQDDIRKLYEAPNKYVKDLDENNGFAKYLSDYATGAVDVFTDKDFYTFGLSKIARNFDLRGIAKKLEDAAATNGQLSADDVDSVLTPGEKAQIQSFYQLAEAQKERANSMSSAYSAGGSFAESIKFMAEFMASQGIANLAGKALSASSSALASWMGRQLMSERALNRAIQKGVTAATQGSKAALFAEEYLAKPVIQGLFHTATQLSSLEGISEGLLDTDDNGKLVTVGRAVGKGVLDQLVENWSESFGGAIEKTMALPFKGLGWAGEHTIANTGFGRWARWLYNSEPVQLLKEAGFNGMIGEIGEEWAGNAVRVGLGLMSKDEFKDFASWEQQLEMAASFAPLSLFGLGTSTMSAVRKSNNLKRLSGQVQGILQKQGRSQEEIDDLFHTRFDTPEDVAKKLAPYLKSISEKAQSEGATAQDRADYKAVMDFARELSVQTTAEAIDELRKEDRREDLRNTIQASVGQFWQESDITDENGEPVKEQSVRIVTDADGNSYYVQGADERGVSAISTTDGKTKFLDNDAIASDTTQPMSQYLQGQLDAIDANDEARRMAQERQEQITAIQQAIAANPVITIGTDTEPINATVVNASDVGVTIAWKEDGQDRVKDMTWAEVGQTLGTPIVVKTDAEIEADAGAELDAAKERLEVYHKIQPGSEMTVLMPTGEGDETTPETWRFEKAVMENGIIMFYGVDEAGNSSSVTEDMVGNLEELSTPREEEAAEAEENPYVAGVPVSYTDESGARREGVVSSEDNGGGFTTVELSDGTTANVPTTNLSVREETEDANTPPPVAKYTNEQGEVNEDAFQTAEPAEWAKWNDEQNQDGGADTRQAIEAKIKKLDKQAKEQSKKLVSEDSPNKRREIKTTLAGINERIGIWNGILNGYATREAAEKARLEAEAKQREEAAKQQAAEEEARAKAEEEARKQAEEEARRQAEAEAEAARLKAEEEARAQAEEEARRQAEAQAQAEAAAAVAEEQPTPAAELTSEQYEKAQATYKNPKEATDEEIQSAIAFFEADNVRNGDVLAAQEAYKQANAPEYSDLTLSGTQKAVENNNKKILALQNELNSRNATAVEEAAPVEETAPVEEKTEVSEEPAPTAEPVEATAAPESAPAEEPAQQEEPSLRQQIDQMRSEFDELDKEYAAYLDAYNKSSEKNRSEMFDRSMKHNKDQEDLTRKWGDVMHQVPEAELNDMAKGQSSLAKAARTEQKWRTEHWRRNVISRIIQRIQQLPKVVSKALGKLNMYNYVEKKNEFRQTLFGVFHYNGLAYASNASIIIGDKSSYIKKNEGKIIGEDGKQIFAKYPKVDDLFSSLDTKYQKQRLDFGKLRNFLDSVKAKREEEWKKNKEEGIKVGSKKDYVSNAHILLNLGEDNVIEFRFGLLLPFVEYAERIGAKEILFVDERRMVAVKNSKGIAGIMPMKSLTTPWTQSDVTAEEAAEALTEVYGTYSYGENETMKMMAKAAKSEKLTDSQKKAIAFVEGKTEEQVKAEDEKAKKLREKLLDRLSKWQSVIGDVFEVLTSIEDAEAIESKSARDAFLAEKAKGSAVHGFYDTETKKAYLYLPDIKDTRTLDRKILHEVISHKGLSGVMGEEGFNEFCDKVWNEMMTDRDKKEFIDYVGGNATNVDDRRRAADEYIAHVAEHNTSIIQQLDETAWQKFVKLAKEIFNDMLGADFFDTGVWTPFDEELQKAFNQYRTENAEAIKAADAARLKAATERHEDAVAAAEGEETKAVSSGKVAASPQTPISESSEKYEDFGEKIGYARKDVATKGIKKGDGDSRPAWMKKYQTINIEALSEAEKALNERLGIGSRNFKEVISDITKGTDFTKPFVAFYEEKKKGYWGGTRRHYITGENRKPIVFTSQAQFEATLPVFEAYDQGYRIWEKGGKFVIYRNASNNKRVEYAQFDTREEALAYLASPEGCTELLNRKRENYELPALEELTRNNMTDHRGGKDVTPDDILSTFGFRGGEFGNWLNAEERQQFLNYAYDALMDLSELLGISPRALSLNGELSIAFGARGVQGARAHYESDLVVINLTKMKGAGSLAHEWAHALDNYFGLMEAKQERSRQYGSGLDRKYLTESGYIRGGARKEVRDAFAEVMKALKRKTVTRAIELESAEETLASARKWYDRTISTYRTQFEGGRHTFKYNRKTKKYDDVYYKPTESQLAEFDRLVAQLEDDPTFKWEFDITKMGYRGQGEVATKLYELVKEIMPNKSGNYGPLNDMFYNLAHRIAPAKKRVKAAQEGQSETVVVDTDMLVDSEWFDRGRASDYYAKDVEMFARGFETYLANRMKEQGKSSDYLTYMKGPLYKAMWGHSPYPDAEELANATAAFDNLFSTIREKTDEQTGRQVLFSKAYHGTGADFDRFDHSFMGTGEGNQAYGWGTYVSTNRETGLAYARTIGGSDEQYERAIRSIENQQARDQMALERAKTDAERRYYEDAIALADKRKEEMKRHLYTVEIPDDNGENYIHWNETITPRQSKKLMDAVRKRMGDEWGPEYEYDLRSSLGYGTYGKHVEGALNYFLGDETDYATGKDPGAERNAKLLNSIGIVGIEIPIDNQGGKRYEGSNYVIFNEDDLKITDHLRFSLERKEGESAYDFANRSLDDIDKHYKRLSKSRTIVESKTGEHAGEYSKETDNILIFASEPKDYADYEGTFFHENLHAFLYKNDLLDDPGITGFLKAFQVFNSQLFSEEEEDVKSTSDYANMEDEELYVRLVENLMQSHMPAWVLNNISGAEKELLSNYFNAIGYDAETESELRGLFGSVQEDDSRGERSANEGNEEDAGENIALQEGGRNLLLNEEVGTEDEVLAEKLRFSKVTDKDTLDKLNSGKTFKAYRAMAFIEDEDGDVEADLGDGKGMRKGRLYSPMATQERDDNGRWRLRQPTEMGAWEQADEHPEKAIQKEDGSWVFRLKKPDGSTVDAAYNPYIHTSLIPLNDQFTAAHKRPELVVVEVEVPESELTSGYKAEKAKDSVGKMTWHSGPVAGQLPEGKKREVVLSRWNRPIRVVPNSEVADKIVSLFEGVETTPFPWNVFTPALREELVKRGVEFSNKAAGTVSKEDLDNYRKSVRFSKTFSLNSTDFDTIQKQAEAKNGIVVKGLWDTIFPIKEVNRHDFTGTGIQAIEKARQWAEKNLAGEHKYHEGLDDEFTYEITVGKDGSIGEMLNRISTTNSSNLGVHLAVLKELPFVIDNSLDVEIHADHIKEKGNRSEKSRINPTMLIHRLYGAVEIDGAIYRVKTTIHENRDKENNAYTYQVTEVELLISGPATGDALSNSTITAANLLKGVEKSYDFGKKLLDAEYLDAVEAGDMATAASLVRKAAEAAGYNASNAYQGSLAFNGAAPSRNDYFETREERKEAFDNGDFEGTYSLGDYVDAGLDNNDLEWQLANPIPASGRDKASLESIRNLNDAVKSGKKTIKMYRAVDGIVREDSFRNGDWVTPSREYAERHILMQDWESGRVIEQEVPIDDIWWNGDDINEWGYDDGKGYAYKNTPNNRKLLDAVTYDDNGNVIPLSERFNENNADVRFSKAYHGSPADFDRFDNAHMGEGEGHQVHGWGTYVTLKKETAEGYAKLGERDMVSYEGPDFPTHYAKELVENMALDYQQKGTPFSESKAKLLKMLESIEEDRKSGKTNSYWKNHSVEKELDFLRSINEDNFKIKDVKRNLYTIDIPDDTGHNYIDEKKNLRKVEREKIADALRNLPEGQWKISEDEAKMFRDYTASQLADKLEKRPMSGGDVYASIAHGLGSKEGASKFLSNAGFVGIKYEGAIDGPSAVIFNEDDIQITDHIRFSKSNENQDIFISNAALAVEGIPMGKATPEQWIKMIESKGGMKAGEDKWLGLSDWLKSQDKKSLTKQEVLDYINENKIRIEEVDYAEAVEKEYSDAISSYQKEYRDFVNEGEAQGESDALGYAYEQMIERYGDDFEMAFDRDGDTITPIYDYYDGLSDAAKYFLDQRTESSTEAINRTRLDYTTSGLDNKREIALTVPTIEPWNEHDKIHFGDAGEGRAIAWIRFGDAMSLTSAKELTDDELHDWSRSLSDLRRQKAEAEASIKRVTGKRLAEEKAKLERANLQLETAQHEFGFNNSRVLFIDEIQSKRHQEGREHGYETEETKKYKAQLAEAVADARAAWREYDKANSKVLDFLQPYKDKLNQGRMSADEYNDVVNHDPTLGQLNKERSELLDIYDKAADRQRALERSNEKFAVPAAPFEKNWHELAMKRMLRLAAEEGYDYVAWTTGDQQAERYNIGGIVDSIERREHYDLGEREYRINVNGRGNQDLITDEKGNVLRTLVADFRDKNLSDIVGKKMANEMLQMKENDVINGEGLRVGGEGMKGFYDDILPRFMNKYGKKWGVKVEDIELPGLEDAAHTAHAVRVTDAMKESVMQGQVMFSKGEQAVEKAHVGGIAEVIGNENVGEFYMDIYRALPKQLREVIVGSAMGSDLNIRNAIAKELSNIAKNGFEKDEAGVLRMSQPILEYYAGSTIGEDETRYILWRGERTMNTDAPLDIAEDIAMRSRLKVGTYAEPVRFSKGELSESLNSADRTAETVVDEAKTEMEHQKQSLRGNLLTITKAMRAQKAYDQGTVNALANLAKTLIKDQSIDALSRREVSRLLGIIRTSVGKSPKMVKKNADTLVEIVIDRLLGNERQTLKNLTSKTGTKVNATGVEVQGELDVTGQNILKAFKEGLTHDVGNVDDSEESLTLYGMRAKNADKLDSKNDAVRKEAEAVDAGLALAIEYKENIKNLADEEKELNDKIDDLKAALKDGDITKAYFDQNVEATEESIRDNRISQIEAYREFRGKLLGVISGSVKAREEFINKENERKAQIQHFANSDMQGRSADVDRKPTFVDRLANSPIIRFFTAPLATFDQMLRLFGSKSASGEGYLWNWFMRHWQTASENAYLGQRDAKSELDKKASEVFGRDMKWSELFDEERRMPRATIKWRDAEGKMQEHELNQGQLLYIYMVNKMADGRMKLRSMGIMEEDVAAIKKQMDERFLTIADWLQDEYLVGLRNKYNVIHERLFGASMAAIDDYFPLVINKKGLNKQEDLASADFDALPSTTTGSIIKRRRNNKALDLMNADAFSVVLNHIDQMEQWAAFAEFNKDLNTLLSYKRFRNQVQNMASVYGSGSTLWQNFKDVCRIAGNAYQPMGKKNSLDSAAVNVAKGVTSAKITFRVYTAIKQFLSMPAFVADANIGHLAADIANPIKAWKWAMENLPLFEKRWKSRIAGDTRLMTTDMDWNVFRSKVYDKLSMLGMSPNAFVDAWTVAVGSHAMYKTKYDRYIKDGYTEEQADKKAKQDATILYNETQQSNENAFLSTVQVDRTWFSTAISVFRNSSMGYQRQLHDAVRNLGKLLKPGYKDESIAFMTKQYMRDGLTEEQAKAAANKQYDRIFTRNAVRVGTFGFLVQFAWNLGGSIAYLLFGDDDKEKEIMLQEAFRHALIGGPLEGLAGGNVMSEALNMVAKGENLRNYDPTLVPVLSDMKRIYSMFGYDKVAAANELVNLAVQATIGTNPQTITDAVVAVVDACDGDLGTAKEAMLLIMRVLQVPQSQIDKIYIDELGVTAGAARRMSYGQMAKRYADYKIMRDAPLTGWAYSDEERKKKVKSKEATFKKKVNERKKLQNQ